MAIDIFSSRAHRAARISVTAGLALLAAGGSAWTLMGQDLLEDWLAAQRERKADSEERALQQVEHIAFTDAAAMRRLQTVTIGPEESLPIALSRIGAPWRDIEAATSAVSATFDFRRMRPGEPVSVAFDVKDGAVRLMGFSLFGAPGEAVTASRKADGGFAIRELSTPVKSEVAHLVARIDGSIYQTALASGATEREVSLVADAFAYSVDFQRDIHPGDGLELVFERSADEIGRTVSTGELLYAALDTRRANKGFYRFTPPGAKIPEWFDETGRSARRFLMRTPINGARLSSSFGMRRHPILGYSKMHRGVDFAAPTGTPILAAGNGVVEKAGLFGGYGRYVRIRHGDGYQTAYAHMSRFARGVRAGARVTQGQVIGYVGTTGRSTGPHLHYEVLRNGAQVNPMSIKAAQTVQLAGEALEAFEAQRRRVDEIRAASGPDAQLIALRSASAAAAIR